MTDWIPAALALASLGAWLHLALLRGGYWQARERLSAAPPALERWPAVAAVVPARNEADVIAETLGSILCQDYPGELRVVLVDDHSEDGTAEAARGAAGAPGAADRLEVMTAEPLPAGWSGKLWALDQGIARATRLLPDASYLWLTDADIAHDPPTLRRLVGKAETDGCAQVSLMARLHCAGFWERLLIPPFVLYFQKLYPFAWANDPGRSTAAAAGGCILAARETFERSGGYAAMKAALIDDCTLARRLKPLALAQGRKTWLGLTESSISVRPYRGLGEIWRMVARSAYTQLGHSPLLLAGTVAGMALIYLVPPVAVIAWPWHLSATAGTTGLAAWALMSLTARPTFRLYRQPPWRSLLLPVAALLYTAMTVDSARRHWRGRGGAWKGRVPESPGGLADGPAGR